MKRKILWIEIVSTTLALLVLFSISLVYINKQNYKTAKDELHSYTNIACEIFDGTNFEEVKKVIPFGNKNMRVTIIDNTGKVIADSQIIETDNHLNREEIQNLGKYVTRYSSSLKTKMMYYAKEDNGYFIRLSIPLASLNSLINSYILIGLITLIFILFLSIMVTILLYNKTLKAVKNEINKLEAALGNDLSNDTDFDHLSSKISELTKTLNEKIASLSNEKEKTKYILDNMNQGLILLTDEGQIDLINKYSLNLFGFTQKYILNKNYVYLFRDLNVQEKIKNCIENKVEEQIIFEMNGKKYLLYINILKDEWSNATNSKIALLIVDITLQENINSLKREFFANASHELKSPLTSIIGYQQLIQQGILTTKEEIKDATTRTITEAKRMNKLIIEMLDLSRLENNVQTMLEEVETEKIVKDVIDELKPLIEKKNINVKLDLEETLINGSQTDLYKLIKNIVENAINYNNENGKLDIELKNNTLTVTDTGVGISNEDLNHIFERFYRVDKARSKESSGTGLGLSIVKHICLLYQYKIDVKSKIGVGTTVKVFFK